MRWEEGTITQVAKQGRRVRLGVDPDNTGAVAIISCSGLSEDGGSLQDATVEVHDMPIEEHPAGKRMRRYVMFFGLTCWDLVSPLLLCHTCTLILFGVCSCQSPCILGLLEAYSRIMHLHGTMLSWAHEEGITIIQQARCTEMQADQLQGSFAAAAVSAGRARCRSGACHAGRAYTQRHEWQAQLVRHASNYSHCLSCHTSLMPLTVSTYLHVSSPPVQTCPMRQYHMHMHAGHSMLHAR